MILGEIRFGILLLGRGARRDRLERWFDGGVARIHCVSWDTATGLRWAPMSPRTGASVYPFPPTKLLTGLPPVAIRGSRNLSAATARDGTRLAIALRRKQQGAGLRPGRKSRLASNSPGA